MNGSCQFSIGNYQGTVTANDNCDNSLTIAQSPALGTLVTGSTTVTMTATDDNGNSASCTFSINPIDGQVPSVTCPGTQNVNFSANCDFTLADYTGSATITDNCDLNPTITQSPAFGTVITSTQIVTITAVDDAGNSNNCTFSVIPADHTLPTITCPSNQNESFSPGCDFTLPDYTTLATAADNCDNNVAIAQSPIATTVITGGQTVILTATDNAGNTRSCTFSVLPDDTTDPTISCPSDQNVSTNAQCQFSIVNYTGLGTAADNCDANPVITQSPVSGTSVASTTTITLTATDANGNTGTCTFDVIPADDTNPTIACPGNQNVSFDASCGYDLLNYVGLANANDNCDPSPTVTQSPVATTNITSTQTITLTVTDANSNTGTCTFDVIPADNTNPSITCPSDDNVSFDANCQYTLTSYTGAASTADNCDASPVVSQSPASGTIITGQTQVTLTATDATGNLSTCTFNVIPDDDVDPTVTCPVNQIISSNVDCDVIVPDYTGSVNADDNCDQSLAMVQSPGSGTIITVAQLVTVTVTDDNGNTANCTFTITPDDDDDPSITCPGDQYEDFDGTCHFDIIDYTTLATATDNCNVSPTVTQDVSVGTTITGQTTITLTATDTESNTATCTFDVIPDDNTAPTVTCPSDQNESVGNQCQFVMTDYTGLVSTSDNCDLAPVVAQSPVSGSVVGGTTVVTVTSTDASGNIGVCTFNVIPADNTDPYLACPADITESFDANCAFTLPDYTSLATVSDNCDVAPFAVTQSPIATTVITGLTTVTLSVTDGASNNTICTFDVIPDDDENPTIVCPADAIVSFDGNCQFVLADYTTAATVDDNCTISPLVSQFPSAGSTRTMNTLVTLTVTDDAGNTATCSFNVTPEDNTDPTVTCPGDQTVNFTGNCEFTLPDYTGLSTFDDNCDNTPFVSQSPGTGAIISGNTTVTITVLDDAGNTNTCTFDVLPNDVQNPVLVCPSDITVALSASCDYSVGDYRSLVTATDNCDTSVDLVQSPASGNTVGSTTPIFITGTDDAGNSASCNFNLILEDQTDPTITCPGDQNVTVGPSCQFTMVSYIGLSTSSDNCDPTLSITQSPVAGSSIGGSTSVTLFAEDDAGNVGTCTFNVNTSDSQAPNIFGCPTDITVNNDAGNCDAVVNFAAITATDNCDGVVVPVQTTGQASGTIFAVGTQTNTFVATDLAGNSATCIFDVTVVDNEDPIVTCPSSQNVNVDPTTCGAVVSYTAPTATDNCTSPVTPTLSVGPASGAIFPLGTTTVTYVAADGNGNDSSCSFTVTVVDNENPTITCPTDIVASTGANSCNAFVSYSLPTVSDNCGTGLVPTLTAGQNSGSSFALGTTTVSYQVNDGNGNSATCSFSITVEDHIDPLILACPLDITQNIQPGTCGATVVYPAINAIDNCAGTITPTLTSGQASGTIFPLSTTTVTYLAEDGNGNSSTCSFVVTIIDNEAPVITCPADITVTAEPNTCGADVTYTLPTVTDNCTSPITPSLDGGLASGSNFPVGTTIVTYGADDGNGNTASCSFDVVVTDDEMPSITCPADITVNNDAGICGAVVTYNLPTVTDNCTPGIVPTLTLGLPSGDTFPVGTTPIRYQAIDVSGNTNICSFSVTVDDNEPPVLTCPADIVTVTDPTVCQAVVAYAAVTVADNCTNGITPVLIVGLGSGDPFPAGTTTVTYQGTDAYANVSTCSFSVTVDDNENPTVSCPADMTESFDPACQLVIPDYTGLGTTADNCDAAPVISQLPAPLSTVTGTTVVTLTSTDGSGNSSSCTFTITDNTPPTATCPADQQVGYNISCSFELPDYSLQVISADNCGATSITQSPAIGVAITGQETVTITVEDDFGNSSTCDFEVIPTDNIIPSLTCLGNQTVFVDATCQFELPDYTTQAIAVDNCDTDVDITQSPVATSFITATTAITLTAIDDDGNFNTCSFTITPSDNISPTIVCPATQVEDFDANCSFALLDYTGLATADDNCTSVVAISQNPSPGTTITANTVVTLTATDDNGNTSNNCTFVVQPEDATSPVATCPADAVVEFNQNCEYLVVDFEAQVSGTDNCSSQFAYTQNPPTATVITSATLITATLTDASGNSATCTFTITPEDNIPPDVVCATDQTVVLNSNCLMEIGDYIGFASATDNCSNSITISQSPPAGSLVSAVTTISMTADDGNGNTSVCTFDAIPADLEPPTITCIGDQQVELDANCEFILPDYTTGAVVSDNCTSTLTIVQNLGSSVSGGGGQPGTTISQTETIILTVLDDFGNGSSCSFDVIPSDNIDPIVTCPQDQEVTFNVNCEAVLVDYTSLGTFNDNCGLQGGGQTPVAGTIISAQTQVTFNVIDFNGNTASCSFEVMPVDNSLPTITCPQNITVDLDNNCQFEVLDYRSLGVTEDNCSSLGLLVGQFPPLGTIINSNTVVTLSVEDDNGNEADCSFALVVEDTISPVITSCPADLTVSVSGNCETVVSDYTLQVVASDNCDGVVTISQIPAVGTSLIGAGSNVITMVATDDSGNSVTCEFNATVTDDINPTVTCPANQQLQLGTNCQFVLPDYTLQSSSSDACGTVTLTQSPVAGTAITSQLNTTIIAEDESGNTATCTFFVNPVPMVVTVTGTDATCNSGSNGSATVSVTGGTPPYTEDWGGFNPTALAGGNYAVIVTDANGCPATGSVTIGDGPLFELEITPNGTVYICEGESVQLSAGAGYAVYDWSTGASVASINVSNEASYWVQVADLNGCWSNTDTATVVFYDELTPQINLLPNGLLECSNDSSQSYQWYFNGSPISGATNVSYCPSVSGNYVVAIVDANGCEVESNIAETTVNADAPCLVGINEHGLSLEVYPNPSTGLFTVKYSLEYEMDVELAVFDLLGTRVRNDMLIPSQNGSKVIDLSHEAEGVYLLRITLGNEKVLQQRLVLVR